MKSKITQNIKAIILGLVLTLGLSYASAVFEAPTFSPPDCPPETPACNVPINEGSLPQIKTGSLTLGGLGIVGDFIFLPSTGAQVGQVLTAKDSTGEVEWKDAPTGTNIISFPSGGSGGSTSGIWVKPDGVTSFRVQVWGGGGAGNTGRNDGSNSRGGGGGGAGGYIEAVFTTTAASQNFGYTIGVGGQPASPVCNGSSGTGTVGGAGGSSDFKQLSTGNVLTGYGGTLSTGYNVGGNGGGTGSVPNSSDSTVKFIKKIDGDSGVTVSGGVQSGGAGGSITFSSGGIGVINGNLDGNRYKDGSYPGGGGGGGSGQNTTCPLGAGKGGDGRIVVSW